MTAQPIDDSTPTLATRLEAIEHKLDYIVQRQRYVEELVEEMMPVGREVLSVAATRFQELEDKGYFVLGRELMTVADRVAEAYSPDDVRLLGDNVVRILDTVRNVTQPDVLAVANEATNVIHHADEVGPVNRFGVFKATGEQDVQRGMALAIEILRQIGRASTDLRGTTPQIRAGAQAPRKLRPEDAMAGPAAQPPPTPRREATAQASQEPASTPEPTEAGTVQWEGHTFTAEGYLVDTEAWDRDLANKIAAGLDITLTPEHWTVLEWAREDYLSTGASPNVRRVATGSGAGTAEVYRLFPRTPGKSIAMIAGIPKPVGCV